MSNKEQSLKDFFISYNRHDKQWAEWIAWQLEEAGYVIVIQAWDFRPGGNFVGDMQQATAGAKRTIAVLSPDYLTSKFTQPEWNAAFAQDPTGEEGLLVPIRVEKCELTGLLPQIVYIDLVGLDQASAKQELLSGIKRGRAKPTIEPNFPGRVTHTEKEAPDFPGELLTSEVGEEEEREVDDFSLKFANREVERKAIHEYLIADANYPHIHIHAPRGLGKTYLLQELNYELREEGWQTVWIDFSSDLHRSLQGDPRLFLNEFVRQTITENIPNIKEFVNLNEALEKVGVRLADFDKIILFIDNADRAGPNLLRWIRETFIEDLAEYSSRIQIVASGQRRIPEWRGYGQGRPFHNWRLAELDDPRVVSQVIDDIVARFGARRVREKQENHREAWKSDLNTMTQGLFEVTAGYPLAIERVLAYAVQRNQLLQPDFFSRHHVAICRECLTTITDRILLTLDVGAREAFRGLCIFRYVWPKLIMNLAEMETTQKQGDLWDPFNPDDKSWESWWIVLKNTHLIQDLDPRQMYPIDLIVRQLFALVLKAENEEVYRAKHALAYQEFEKLVRNPTVLPIQRAAYLLEVFYHATQQQHILPEDAEPFFYSYLTDFISEFTTSQEFIETIPQLLTWLREDRELRRYINGFANVELYDQLVKTTQQAVGSWKGLGNE